MDGVMDASWSLVWGSIIVSNWRLGRVRADLGDIYRRLLWHLFDPHIYLT